MGFIFLIDLKDDNYDSILIIIDFLTKMIYYKSIKTIIDIAGLAKITINIVVRHYGL